MGFTRQDDIKQNYIKGLKEVSGDRISLDDISKRLDGFNYNCSSMDDMTKVYTDFTNHLIKFDKEGKRRELNINEFFLSGIIESVSNSVWDSTYGTYNFRKVDNPYWMEMQVSDVYLDLIGRDRAITGLIENPDLMFSNLENIEYERTNLLKYLNNRFDTIHNYTRDYFFRDNILRADDVLNCCEALSDCSDKLRKEKVYVKR